MRRPLSVLLLGLGLGLLATSVAADPPVITPLPFDHAQHRRSLKKVGLDCVDCHPVGRVQSGADPLPEPIPAPREACHGCHLGALPGAPRRVDRSCGSCHPDRLSLLPQDHDAAWVLAHADAARTPGRACADCHEGPWCVRCHDDRGPLATQPHGPGFRSTHGVEARVDPARCSSCHISEGCTACHQRGSLPW